MKKKSKFKKPVLAGFKSDFSEKDYASNNPEILIALSGVCGLEINGRAFPLTAGSAAVFDKGVVKSVSCEGEALSLSVTLSQIDKDCLAEEGFTVVACEQDCLHIAAALKSELSQNLQFKDGLVGALSEALVFHIYRLLGLESFGPSQADITGAAAAYFEEHFADLDNLESYCKEAGVNRFYLTHVFKEAFGIPPVKFIVQKKIEAAKRMLVDSADDINVIADKTGFTDAAYFCRVFKAKEDITPLQYRYREKHRTL